MERSRRAACCSAGYVVAANNASDRNLRIALRNRHKRAAKALNNDDNKQQNVEQTKKQSHPKVMTRQSLASIGKKARHPKKKHNIKIE